MANGWDIRELEKLGEDLIDMAQVKMPKESKKFIKKQANGLKKQQKTTFKSIGVGENGITEKEVLSRFKSGKVYKRSDAFCARALNSHPLSHLLNDGFIHKGGKDKTGKESFVPGYHFIEKAEKAFESTYNQGCEEFIEEIIRNIEE